MYGHGIPRSLAQLGSRLDYWRRVRGSSIFLKVFGFSRDSLSEHVKNSRYFEKLENLKIRKMHEHVMLEISGIIDANIHSFISFFKSYPYSKVF